MIWKDILVLHNDEFEVTRIAGPSEGSRAYRLFRKNHVIAVARTSRAIYNDVMPFFYSKNNLFFRFKLYLLQFLKKNPHARRFITSLRVPLAHSDSLKIFNSLLNCHQLRHLQVETIGGICDSKTWRERHPLTSGGLSMLLKLRGLKSFKITKLPVEFDDQSDEEYYEKVCAALEIVKQPKVVPSADQPVLRKKRGAPRASKEKGQPQLPPAEQATQLDGECKKGASNEGCVARQSTRRSARLSAKRGSKQG